MELAGIGILASLELYKATEKQRYADKAVELAKSVKGVSSVENQIKVQQAK